MKRLTFLGAAAAAFVLLATGVRAEDGKDGWKSLFNGKDLAGWTSNDEVPGVFSVEDGAIRVKGGRAHLFYTGDVNGGKFRNFEFKAKVLTKKNANSGIYFATEFQKSGWPAKGYECQVNNSFDKDPRRTGSLYAISDVKEKLVPDDEWFDYYIRVEGSKITIAINGKTVVEYTESDREDRSSMPGRWIRDGGTFAFQAHDPGCEVYYKDIYVKPLP